LLTAAAKERDLKNFFLNITTSIRSRGPLANTEQAWNAQDREIHALIISTQAAVHSALLTNLNYPEAMGHIFKLVGEVNKYHLKDCIKTFKALILEKAAAYVHRMMRVFGMFGDEEASWIGAGGEGGDQKEDARLGKILDAFAKFRDQIRSVSQKKKDGDILKLCDSVRDDILPALGIQLEDKKDGGSTWKLDNPQELLKLKEEKKTKRNCWQKT